MKEILKGAAGSVVIFNSAEKPKMDVLKKNKIKAYYLDASEIGKRLAGKYAPAAAMLGALAKKFNKLSVKNIKASVQHEVGGAETDIACIEEGYRRVS